MSKAALFSILLLTGISAFANQTYECEAKDLDAFLKVEITAQQTTLAIADDRHSIPHKTVVTQKWTLSAQELGQNLEFYGSAAQINWKDIDHVDYYSYSKNGFLIGLAVIYGQNNLEIGLAGIGNGMPVPCQ
jgi:hypothetical protein